MYRHFSDRRERAVDFNLADLGEETSRFLAGLPGPTKVFGSALWDPEGAADIDVAVQAGDDDTFARVLAAGEQLRLHPVRLQPHVYRDLHLLLSWRNACAAYDVMDGRTDVSPEFVDGAALVFNPASRAAFPSFLSARKAAQKMERLGMHVPPAEKARAELHLGGNTDSLVKIARAALGEEIVNLLAYRGAVVAGGFFRDEIDGRAPKDLDVFVPAGRGWADLCDELGKILEEVEFDRPAGSRVNLRKFRAASPVAGHEFLVIDVIDYGFVHAEAHVVETFDFAHNTLWWSPGRSEMQGGMGRSAGEIRDIILQRRLIVGDNTWYRAGQYRALKRWQRFRADGYVADEENVRKYAEYVRLLGARRQEAPTREG